jgi:hypothetical protein
VAAVVMMGGMITNDARKAWRIVLFATLAAATAVGQAGMPVPLNADQIAAAKTLASDFEAKLKRSRYMESGDGVPVTIPGWEGFPTRQFTYEVTDKDGTKKPADVVLLDPSADQIARWIVQALVEVRGTYDPAAGAKLFKHILGQSGGQFPVRGVVYEDILPEDGKNEIYCFHDGVTTAVEGVPHRGTEGMTDAERKASIESKVTRVYTYARIQSTSPAMWIAAGGAEHVVGADGKPSQKWLDEVRKAYQAAWTSDRNELMVAWVKAQKE